MRATAFSCISVRTRTMAPTSDVTPAICRARTENIRPRASGRRLQAADHRTRGLSRAFRLHAIEFVVQGLEADAENLGGARLVVVRVLEREQNQTTLGLADGHARRQPLAGRFGLSPCQTANLQPRQMLRVDEFAVGHDGRAFDDVPELTHIAGPRVLLEL